MLKREMSWRRIIQKEEGRKAKFTIWLRPRPAEKEGLGNLGIGEQEFSTPKEEGSNKTLAK